MKQMTVAITLETTAMKEDVIEMIEKLLRDKLGCGFISNDGLFKKVEVSDVECFEE